MHHLAVRFEQLRERGVHVWNAVGRSGLRCTLSRHIAYRAELHIADRLQRLRMRLQDVPGAEQADLESGHEKCLAL